MKVFVAGATGVIGRPLVAALRGAGHEVAGTTRTAAKLDALRSLGAEPHLCDAFDAAAVRAAVERTRPDVIVNQLTDLPDAATPRGVSRGAMATGRIRVDGTRHLLDAARACGVQRFVTQSIAFIYAPGPGLRGEEDPVDHSVPPPFDAALRDTVAMERMVLDGSPAGVVLRYGQLYGPGTWYGREGALGRMLRRRLYPIIGDGGGVFSWLHVDDAASAAVRAVESDVAGLFNVVDDEPAPVREWLPAMAAAFDAPRPLRVPEWLARLLAGPVVVAQMTRTPGVSNRRARGELGWSPSWPSWREGFRCAPC